MLAVVIGLPVAFVFSVLMWGYFSDETNGSIVSSGVTRRYLLYVPKTYDRSRPTPLVISFHPAATWPAFERNVSGWNELANQYGFIVVYPAGSGAFFGTLTRGANIWPAGPHTLPRDVRFISDLIDKFEAEYNIDSTRIYADGMSNGGGMAFLLSRKLSDRIAAVGVVSGALPGTLEDCGDSKPVPTIAFHGTADKVAPFLGGWLFGTAWSHVAQGGNPTPRTKKWTTKGFWILLLTMYAIAICVAIYAWIMRQ